jgi:hypothetical protein
VSVANIDEVRTIALRWLVAGLPGEVGLEVLSRQPHKMTVIASAKEGNREVWHTKLRH